MTSPLQRCLLISMLLTTAACSTGPQPQPDAQTLPPEPALFTPDNLLFESDEEPALAVYDPWEGLNRRIYNFNYHFDRFIFLPAVNTYKWITPDPVETGVTNFFNNFQDMTTALNSLLQLKPEKFFQATGRVFVNTTLGLLGIFDVAATMDIPRPRENFGETLGHWGVGQGPYVVIPFLGPANLRDGIGLIPDYYLFQGTIRQELWTRHMRTYGFLAEAVDTRANTSFRYYENGSAFEYETVRLLWSTKRELDVAK